MAKGEGSTYSSAGKKVVAFDFKPLPAGDYDLLLQSNGLEVRRSQEKGPDAIPYISCRFEAQGTAQKEGGKNRLVFHSFFLSLKPGSDGVIMPERGGGIVQFLRANGQELEGIDVKTVEKEDGTSEDYLDAEAVLELLQDMTDSVTKGHVAVEAGRDRQGNVDPKAPGRNKVSNWLGAEEAEEEEGEEEKPKASNKKPLPKKK